MYHLPVMFEALLKFCKTLLSEKVGKRVCMAMHLMLSLISQVHVIKYNGIVEISGQCVRYKNDRSLYKQRFL